MKIRTSSSSKAKFGHPHGATCYPTLSTPAAPPFTGQYTHRLLARTPLPRRGSAGSVQQVDLSSYESFGDITSLEPPTRAEISAQRSAGDIAASVERMHFHEVIRSDGAAQLISHCHDNDAVGHEHQDGRGRWMPSMAKHPGLSQDTPRRLEAIASQPRGPQVEWALRLFCGHVVRRTAHADYGDIRRAGTSRACEECGLQPATIIAARPEGLISRDGDRTSQLGQADQDPEGSEPHSSELIPPKGDGVPPGWHRVEQPVD